MPDVGNTDLGKIALTGRRKDYSQSPGPRERAGAARKAGPEAGEWAAASGLGQLLLLPSELSGPQQPVQSHELRGSSVGTGQGEHISNASLILSSEFFF